mmetsp:Transcript_2017/g.6762  ORF Transcript_2017/g.6762 Transcript_2017/m.6762 type:complete len:212 (-) Transcript_2017:349-984(-)
MDANGWLDPPGPLDLPVVAVEHGGRLQDRRTAAASASAQAHKVPSQSVRHHEVSNAVTVPVHHSGRCVTVRAFRRAVDSPVARLGPHLPQQARVDPFLGPLRLHLRQARPDGNPGQELGLLVGPHVLEEEHAPLRVSRHQVRSPVPVPIRGGQDRVATPVQQGLTLQDRPRRRVQRHGGFPGKAQEPVELEGALSAHQKIGVAALARVGKG